MDRANREKAMREAMSGVAVAVALASAFFFGLGLTLTQRGLRHVAPGVGAAISIPTSTLLFVLIAPFVIEGRAAALTATAIFAGVGVLFPATVTLLTFAGNRRLGPIVTGALGNLAPMFAVAFAIMILGEPPRAGQIVGLAAILAGVAVLSAARYGWSGGWNSWYLLLPLAAAALRGLIQPVVKLGLERWPSPFAAVLIGYLVSTVVVLGVSRLQTGHWIAAAPKRGRLWFAIVGVCNGLAVFLMYAALARGPVTLVSPLVATYPLVTVAASALLLGRLQNAVQIVAGVVLTVAGVGLLLAGAL